MSQVATAGRLSLRRRIGVTYRPTALEAVCLAVVLVLLVLVILGPVVAPKDPNASDLLRASEGASTQHLLGTDDTGRDILSRIIVGARETMIAPAIVIAAASIIGTSVALLTAWIGGRFDAVVARVLNVLFAFPSLLLAILASGVVGIGITGPVLALTIAYTPYIARVVRSAAQRERALPYVEALVIQGAGAPRVLARHVLPNLAPLILIQATVAFGYVVLDLAAVSFLGLGSQPPSSQWGLMVSDGRSGLLEGQEGQALYPGIAIAVTVLAISVLGNRLAARVDEGTR